ncbi:MAG TPA: ABC transporter substrate-binding protein [Kaistia sp.]|nr:ABC transporter substrate-binding protein [Kaistia sp.]
MKGINQLLKGGAGAAALAAGLLGAGSALAADLTILTSWTNGDARRPALDRMVEAFKAKTGLTIDVQASANEGGAIASIYETALLANKEPDLVLASLEGKMNDWAKDKAVVPAGDLLKDWNLSATIPAEAIADWTDSAGNVVGLPYLQFTWPWWYNMDRLKEAGITKVPETTDELIADAKALRAAGIDPVIIGGSDWSGQKMLLQIIQSFMSPDEARKVFVNGGWCANPNAMKGLELFTHLRDEGVFVDDVQGLTANDSASSFVSGDAAITSMGSWSYKDGDTMTANVVLAGFPTVEGGTYKLPTSYAAATLSGWYVSPAGAKKLDTLSQFIKFAYEPDQIASLMDHTGAIPVVPVDPAVAGEKSGSATMAKSFSELPGKVDLAVMPDIWVPGSVSEALYRAVTVVFTAGVPAKEACAALDGAYGK